MHPEFPHHDLIHLNHAAVGPWPLRTAEAVTAFARENTVTGSLHYGAWLKVEEATRALARRLLGAADTGDVAFVKNTSEALSIVAFGLPWHAGQNVVIPKGEFPSNRVVWIKAAERFGLEFREVELPYEEPEAALLAACDRETALVSCSAVQFATGLRLDLEQLGTALRRKGVLFCVDAIQHLGALPFDVRAAHADFVMADAHKWLLAPEGIAVFYVRPEVRGDLVLQEYGWHMLADAGDYNTYELTEARDARRFEPGSPNLLGIHALQASLSLLLEPGMEAIAAEIDVRWQHLYEGLRRLGCRVVTPTDPKRHAGILTFLPSRGSTESLFRALLGRRVLCAQRGGGIRFSPHFYLPFEALDRALAAVAEETESE
jgi:cysteine desulfurase / selenocysteine lyase